VALTIVPEALLHLGRGHLLNSLVGGGGCDLCTIGIDVMQVKGRVRIDEDLARLNAMKLVNVL
jgi:hypothetical protein